jgi:hypothetical protein
MFEKPLRGAYTLERKRKAREHKAREADIMRRVVAEDGHKCRVPRCAFGGLRVECAHQVHRGIGGNKAEDRTLPHLLIALCQSHHAMWDRGKLDIVPLTEQGMRGPCEFHYGPVLIGRETTARVSVTREAR